MTVSFVLERVHEFVEMAAADQITTAVTANQLEGVALPRFAPVGGAQIRRSVSADRYLEDRIRARAGQSALSLLWKWKV
jgi:hypothetical protein